MSSIDYLLTKSPPLPEDDPRLAKGAFGLFGDLLDVSKDFSGMAIIGEDV